MRRRPTEHTARMSDGTELFYRVWPAAMEPASALPRALLLFHRGHEHSGRFQDVVDALDLDDCTIFAWDARGHGRSPGERGYAPSFGRMVRDVEDFVRHVQEAHGIPTESMVVLGHSVGGVTVATWVHDYAPDIRGLVLATPALRVKLYVPFAIPGLRLMRWWKGNRKSFVKSYVRSKMLTHDRSQARQYDEDPLIAREIAVNILLDLYDASTRLIADAGAIQTATLLLCGGADWVVRTSAQDQFYQRLGARDKRQRYFEGMYHDILHERDRHQVLSEISNFVRRQFACEHQRPSLVEADHWGHTRDEFDRLSRPLPRFSWNWLRYGVQTLAMNTLGRLSRGVRLGLTTGFDSGKTLDYVYRNQPSGAMLVGRWIDNMYLNSLGWRGIRQRKVHLEQLLTDAVEQTLTRYGRAHVLDIATGCGRYVLETLRSFPRDTVSATLRDYRENNLDEGRRLAAEMRLPNVKFVWGDAFDEQELAAIEPKPHIAIVSGLYELFPGNEEIRRSLRGVANALHDGGLLIYTGQPWHPQVEEIARTLTNREGQPWVMRRRTQWEMDDLVREAGLSKLNMLIDEFGIFTVSVAVKGRHVSEA
ncbi:MAG: bifunctional alpha/beta hydrolase/class I SAM-dependent methyltransferase [Pirellulaceae bacterium]